MLFGVETILVVGTIVVACVAMSTLGAVVLIILGYEVYEEWVLDGKPWIGKELFARAKALWAKRPQLPEPARKAEPV